MKVCVVSIAANRWQLTGLIALLVLTPAGLARAGGQLDRALAADANRVIHRFDFDEPENFDTLPKNWIRFPDAEYADAAFPRYTEGGFDVEVGHDNSPSFYLQSRGRNVAYRYNGPETRIRPGNHLVTAWVKCDAMGHARAALSAYYLDWEGQYLPETQEFSRLLSSQSGDGWQQVQVHLTRAPREAHYVGLTCWVIQQDVWRQGEPPHRHIAHRDVRAGAWFDDIAVLGLPRAVLRTANPGNIFEQPEPVQLLTTVSDTEVSGLTARLRVRDREGTDVFITGVPCTRFDQELTERTQLPHLAPGLYRAELDVFTGADHLLERHATFAVLAESERPRNYLASRMGVIFDGAAPGQSREILALVDALRLGAVKLPLWSPSPQRLGFDAAREDLHELLDALIENRVSVTGVFAGPPSAMARSAGAYARSLLDILSEDPEGWRGALHAIVAPYASILTHWQIGADGDASFIHDDRVPDVLEAVREVMREMVTSPRLTTVAFAGDLPSVPHAAENLSVAVPDDIRPEMIDAHLAPYRSMGHEHLWASLTQPDPHRATDAELADWALRLVEARWAGMDTVFVPQLWKTRSTLNGNVTEPYAAYIVYRTVLEAIGDAVPAHRLRIGESAVALAFNDAAQAVLVLWDPQAPPEGRAHTLQLGSVRRVVDIWGRPVPLEKTPDGRHRLQLTSAPVFAQGTEPWLIAFRAGLGLRPRTLDFSVEPQSRALEIHNPRPTALSGSLVLTAPDGWEVTPHRLQFALEPGARKSFALAIRHPHGEPAGETQIRAQIAFLADRAYVLDVPLPVDLGAEDLDVWGYAVIEDDTLLLRHGVTNRADEPLSFQLFAVYPGRSRQYRAINLLLPGQTLTAEYRFPYSPGASGRPIRLGLREVNGPRIHNAEVSIP